MVILMCYVLNLLILRALCKYDSVAVSKDVTFLTRGIGVEESINVYAALCLGWVFIVLENVLCVYLLHRLDFVLI